MKRLLLLGASSSQIPFINTAKELGVYVGVVDYNNNAPAIAYADEYFECSIADDQAVADIARKFKPDGITSGASDVGVLTAAKVCEQLGLPSMSVETAHRVKDKGIMIEAFKKEGVEHPGYQVINDESQEITIDYPLIIKPVDNSASRGINLVRSEEELKKSIEDSFSHSRSHTLIVEEYIDGPEVSVELLIQHGEPHVLQVTDKITTGEPHFIETGHSQPSQLPEKDVLAIKDLAIRAAKAVGIQDGCGHAEIKITDAGPKMIEIAGRMGADYITTVLVPLSTGINMAEYEILRAIGEPKEFNPSDIKAVQGVAVKFIQPDAGRVKSLNIRYTPEELSQIEDIEIGFDADTSYGKAADNNDRIGHVIAVGKTASEALEKCDEIIAKTLFEYRA